MNRCSCDKKVCSLAHLKFSLLPPSVANIGFLQIGKVIYMFHSAKCVSKTLMVIDKQYIKFLRRANYRSKNRNGFRKERIIVGKFTVNYRAMRIIVQKIVRIKTIGVTKMRVNFVEISFQAKFLRKARNFVKIRLHNTVIPWFS